MIFKLIHIKISWTYLCCCVFVALFGSGLNRGNISLCCIWQVRSQVVVRFAGITQKKCSEWFHGCHESCSQFCGPLEYQASFWNVCWIFCQIMKYIQGSSGQEWRHTSDIIVITSSMSSTILPDHLTTWLVLTKMRFILVAPMHRFVSLLCRLYVHEFVFLVSELKLGDWIYLYCCTVHLVDSLIITLPTNALIVCHLF